MKQAEILLKAEAANELAKQAFADGDLVTGLAAISLAGQLVQLAKLWQPVGEVHERR
jgi:hypothetical protein